MACIQSKSDESSLETSDLRQNLVRNLLGMESDSFTLSKYENVLINLLGYFHLVNETEMKETQKEILDILQESGINSRDRWLDVLTSVNVDRFVLDYITELPGFMDGTVEIRNSNVYAYAMLFESKQPQSVRIMVGGDPDKVLRFRDLLKQVRSHGIRINEILINDANAKVIEEELDMSNARFVNLESKETVIISE